MINVSLQCTVLGLRLVIGLKCPDKAPVFFVEGQ